jgi:tripartite-type tricarboxylate transporter receptor subunit TctC
LHLAAGAAALPVMPRLAWAQAYPTRPVRWIVGFPPGGGADTVARIAGQWLSDRLGQPVIIENKPGGGTNLSVHAVVNSPPDGYTLLLVGSPAAINATLYPSLPFNFLRDIAPVAGLVWYPLVLEAHPSVPTTTVAELIARAKANPGKITMASVGIGTSSHVAGEMFKMMTGVNMVHVPYRGASPALTDLISGQVHVMFGPLPPSIEFIRSGKLRALAVTTQTRSQALPDVPTVAEFVPGYEASGWNGVGAPKNTPADVIDKLNREINAALADPDINARLADLGGTPLAGSAAEFGTLVAEETEKWAKVVRFSGAKPD